MIIFIILLILRRPRSGRLEGRIALIQRPFAHIVSYQPDTIRNPPSSSSRRRPGPISGMGTGLRRCDEKAAWDRSGAIYADSPSSPGAVRRNLLMVPIRLLTPNLFPSCPRPELAPGSNRGRPPPRPTALDPCFRSGDEEETVGIICSVPRHHRHGAGLAQFPIELARFPAHRNRCHCEERSA